MKFIRIIRQSIRALMSNKVRTFLTTLGIIIGIGSVIGLISLGQGVQSGINNQISTLGSRNLTVVPGEGFSTRANNPSSSSNFGITTPTLTVEDFEALKQIRDESISKVSGNVSGSSIFPIGGSERRRTVTGISPEYFEINGFGLSSGRLFAAEDNNKSSRVVVLGTQSADDIFGPQDVLNKTLKIADEDFAIIGILSEKAETGFSNPNRVIYIPEQAALEVFKTDKYSAFVIQATSDAGVDTAKAKVEETLLTTHKITNKALADFSVSSAKDLLSTIDQITGILTALLAGIAAISLVVGGIGIMNIMLVSVTERTREIGLRKAVGARTSDIMFQFITESILLTMIGGVFGILLGFVIGQVVSKLTPLITPIISLETILLAVGVSSLIGIVFGVYPAAKAARLNPIDALRYE